MIVEIILYTLSKVIDLFAQILPGYGTVPLPLPWGLDSMLVTGVQGYKVLSTAFPPMQVVMDAFLIYISFKIVVQILKAIPFIGRTLR